MRKLAALALLLSLAPQPSQAGAQLAVRAAGDVLRVSAPWPGGTKPILDAVRAGGVVSVRWRFTIERIAPWWRPDATIGEVELVRILRPDLLAGRFVVEEHPSGIVWDTPLLTEALRRMLRLGDFPLIDLALLEHGVSYRLRVEIERFDGEPPQGWWARLWHSPAYTMDIEFRAP